MTRPAVDVDWEVGSAVVVADTAIAARRVGYLPAWTATVVTAGRRWATVTWTERRSGGQAGWARTVRFDMTTGLDAAPTGRLAVFATFADAAAHLDRLALEAKVKGQAVEATRRLRRSDLCRHVTTDTLQHLSDALTRFMTATNPSDPD